MTALGISLIVIGIALVCAGLGFWPRLSLTGPSGLGGPHEFRAIIDALASIRFGLVRQFRPLSSKL
jgi:hypothetical protein